MDRVHLELLFQVTGRGGGGEAAPVKGARSNLYGSSTHSVRSVGAAQQFGVNPD